MRNNPSLRNGLLQRNNPSLRNGLLQRNSLRLRNSPRGTSVTLWLVMAMAIFCTTGCQSFVDADKKRQPSISKSRILGSPCGPTDSASIKRVNFHPQERGSEASAWNLGRNDFLDANRTMNVQSNSLTRYHNSIVGFVKFDKPGSLRVRCYDDAYGDIFCGWNPKELEVKPTQKPVFVSVDLCNWIGKDGVHELCWFPSGAKEGVIIFSTAQPEPGQKLTAADVYGPEQLGNRYQYFDNIAADAINASLQNGKFDKAQKVIDDSFGLLSTMHHSQDGDGKEIPLNSRYTRERAMLRTYELGMALGDPSFAAKKKAVEDIINGPHWKGAGELGVAERQYRDMLPIYAWLNEQITNKKSALPKFAPEQNYIAGHDPKTVAAYLQSAAGDEKKLSKRMFSNIEFWVAVKHFLRKDYKEAEKQLNVFLNDKHTEGDAFEVAAAAKLKEFEFFELHPEK